MPKLNEGGSKYPKDSKIIPNPKCLLGIPGCPSKINFVHSHPQGPMSITSLQICLSQVAKACKDAVAERGAFALAIPGGSILKVPLVRVTLWGSSAKMTRGWWV